jgi:hypothetical protein
MSRKDYVGVADVIASQVDSVELATWGDDRDARLSDLRTVAEGLADVFSANPRFDRDRFLTAAGVDEIERLS